MKDYWIQFAPVSIGDQIPKMESWSVRVLLTPVLFESVLISTSVLPSVRPLHAQRMSATLITGDYYREWLRRKPEGPSLSCPASLKCCWNSSLSLTSRAWRRVPATRVERAMKSSQGHGLRDLREPGRIEENTSLVHSSARPTLTFSYGPGWRRKDLEREAHSAVKTKQEIRITEYLLTHKVQIFPQFRKLVGVYFHFSSNASALGRQWH